ncbi:unnamed protein product, partial [Callosobruchus maculatus]
PSKKVHQAASSSTSAAHSSAGEIRDSLGNDSVPRSYVTDLPLLRTQSFPEICRQGDPQTLAVNLSMAAIEK